MSLLTAARPATSPEPDSTPPAVPDDAQRARWERPALAVLLVGTAVLYLWSLGASGYANSFYAAAAQAGSESWKAFFFGSSDAANSITVDKTPLSLWPMALSIRVFGLSSWSLLVPQALEGVATVALLYATVKRSTRSSVAGLIAGVVMATTPVAVLMFRFDNPDSMLVLLMVAGVWATLRALESPKAMRWMALAGMFIGFAFLAKQLQSFLVIPTIGLTYLFLAKAGWLKRIGHLAVGLAAMVASAGWWVLIASLWPASSRPYFGGSQDNSILELTLGYNGLGRLTGDETGSVTGGGGTGTSMWGSTGITRMLGSEVGGQIAWLLPTALVLLVAGLWLTRRAPRVGTTGSSTRAALVVWGGWLLVTALTFSFMAGIFHAYYTVALAPAIGALVGTGCWLVWQHRRSLVASFTASATLSLTAVFAFYLLGQADGFVPWLRWVVLVGGLVVALAVAGLGHLPKRLAAGVAVAALLIGLAGPTAYAVDTAATPHTGSIPTAGPTTAGGGFGGGGMRGGTPPTGGQTQGQTQGQAPGGTTQGGGFGGFGAGGGTGGAGNSLLDGSTSTAAITALLQANASDYTWVAAAVGSNTASGYQLATEDPVMAIGGFNGSDPSPTLAQFEQYVAEGKIHYFIGGGGFGGQNGGSSASSDIASWVEQNFSSQTVDGVTIYDLTQSTSGTSTTTSGTNA